MKQRILLLTLAFAMAIGIPSISYGMTPANPSIIINGDQVDLEESFINKNGKLMIPLSPLIEQLNYGVKWGNQNKSVTLIKEDQEVSLKVGALDGASILKNDKLFVSAEFLSKSLHHVLGWNSKNQSLNIRNIKDADKDLFTMSTDKETRAKLNNYMKALVSNENFHGSVLIAKGGEILLNQGYGYADFAQKIQNKSQTRFPIGSVTKQFTALAALKLSERGLLNVDDKVSQYIPDFPHGNKMTIHHLLTHTSGLVNYTDLDEFYTVDRTNKDTMKMLDLVKGLDLSFNPGEMFEYSNTNYLLLGIIIEKITGDTFSTYLDEITKPIGMEDTGIIASKNGRVNDATPYAGYLEVHEMDDDLVLSQTYAAGSMYATVEDLYRWNRSIKTQAILNKDLLEEMFKEHVTVSGGISYGYGWIIEETRFGKEIYHVGNTLGSTAYTGRLEDEDITLIILTNNRGYHTDMLKNNLFSIILGKEYEMPKALKEIQIRDKDLYSHYAGRYEFIDGGYLDIFENENKLYAQVTGQVAFEIFPHTMTKFFGKILQVNIEFIPGLEGKTTTLTFRQGGMEFVCNRVDNTIGS